MSKEFAISTTTPLGTFSQSLDSFFLFFDSDLTSVVSARGAYSVVNVVLSAVWAFSACS